MYHRFINFHIIDLNMCFYFLSLSLPFSFFDIFSGTSSIWEFIYFLFIFLHLQTLTLLLSIFFWLLLTTWSKAAIIGCGARSIHSSISSFCMSSNDSVETWNVQFAYKITVIYFKEKQKQNNMIFFFFAVIVWIVIQIVTNLFFQFWQTITYHFWFYFFFFIIQF